MAGTGKKQPYGVGNIVSWGATVVIIGLLFKIQHWNYGTFFITAGLSAEALLFFILGFVREDVGYDWGRAYPELHEDFDGELPKARKSKEDPNFPGTAALDKMLADAKIGPQLIGSLADGLRTFGDKVNSISKVTDAGEATIAFTAKVKEATASYSGLNAAFEKATANINDLAKSSTDSKAYTEQVNLLAKNLTSLNSVYELELQDSSAHFKTMNKFYQNISLTMGNFNESLNDSKTFKDEIGKLSKNLTVLNSIYGNMINAMNAPRVS
jgi:gliding motility-associated protein GldL